MKWSQSKNKGEQTEAEPLAKPKDVTGMPAAEEEPIREEAVNDPDMTEFPYQGRKKYLWKKHGRTLKYLHQELQQA